MKPEIGVFIVALNAARQRHHTQQTLATLREVQRLDRLFMQFTLDQQKELAAGLTLHR